MEEPHNPDEEQYHQMNEQQMHEQQMMEQQELLEEQQQYMQEEQYEYQHHQDSDAQYGHEQHGEYDDEDQDQQELGEDDEMYRQPANNAMLEEIHRIERQVAETQMKWCDPDFGADDKSLYLDPMDPPEYANDIPQVDWKRPEEIYTSTDEVYMMKDPQMPGEVKSGLLADQWLLGTFSSLGMNPELLRNLIVYDGIKSGFAVFQFFKNGRWQFVTVDTRIPYNPSTKTPLYGYCANPDEFWVPLIEKAYAKMHGSYQILCDGKIEEALVDMTGGVAEKYDLKNPETKQAVDSGQFWKDLKKLHQQGFIVVCENEVYEEEGRPVDSVGPKGIQFNKAYGMMQMRDLPDISNLQLVFIRNPWGPGQAVWQGAFADEDEAWDDYKGLKERLEHQFRNDGNWWMRFEDWKSNFTTVYVCKIFPSTWAQFSVASEWKGNTNGGPYPGLHDAPKGGEETKEQNAALDTCDRWFNNPQFRLSVTKKTTVIISLMQEDKRIS